jgi:methylmalonyl-CoA/ethylmalonyl-CoA epimerase
MPALNIVGFSHIGFAVSDIPEFQRTWGELLGMTDWKGRETETLTGLQLHGQPVGETTQARTATARIGGTAIELVQPIKGPIHHGEHLDRFGPSVHHLAFWVADLTAEVDNLDALGWDIAYSPTSLPGGLSDQLVSATTKPGTQSQLVGTDIADAELAPFFAFVETKKPAINCAIELLDAQYASRFRESFGSHTYYPGDLPG